MQSPYGPMDKAPAYEQEILGSSPSMGFFFLGDNPDASVAERLRRWIQVPVNFVGVGSIPTGCTFLLLLLHSRRRAKKLLEPRIELGTSRV